MCVQFAFYHQFGINTWEVKVWAKDRQYSFCLWILWTKTTRVLMWSTWVYRVVHNTCIKHGKDIKTQKNSVDINLAIEKGLKFYQTRSNAIILQETLPAYCIPKVVRMETGEVMYEKVNMSPRPPPKISLKHEWKRELGSEHAQRPEVEQLSRSFQSNQPILNPSRERTVEVLCTTPHIYEQKTAQTMATSRTCLSTTSTLACTWSRTTLRPEHLSTDH